MFIFFICFIIFSGETIIRLIQIYSIDPDQTPRFAASDLGLPCLPMSFFMCPQTLMG